MLEESNKEEETMTTDELKEMIYEMLNQGITVEEAIDIKSSFSFFKYSFVSFILSILSFNI